MIKYYNRQTESYEVEQIAGEKYLNWTYCSPIGMSFLKLFIRKKLFSKIYGNFCNSKHSKRKIQKFITNFNIDMSESTNSIDDFTSFNDFFTRKLNQNARKINLSNNILISPCDGKILAYENIDLNNLVQVKGFTYKLSELTNNIQLSQKYSNGTCLIYRLCPTDYHRFHFIDDGICTETTKIKGDYYSVNPTALKKIPKLFCRNKREYSILKSNNFGEILYVEVGATCVGTILQTYTPNKCYKKGSEKGYFKFGGSTIILFFEKNKVKIDSDILTHSLAGCETKILMGEQVGIKI